MRAQNVLKLSADITTSNPKNYDVTDMAVFDKLSRHIRNFILWLYFTKNYLIKGFFKWIKWSTTLRIIQLSLTHLFK
jgi:hypothetical protein